MFKLEVTTQEKYDSLIKLETYSKLDIISLSKYPYKSLTSLFGNISNYEKTKIKEIENLNIVHFLNVISVLFGFKNGDTFDLFIANLNKEPLRTALFLARQEPDPEEKFGTFVYYACKILLSNGGKTNTFVKDPIDVQISGKMPFSLFSNRQNIANDWYKSFVEHKLFLAKKALRFFEKEEVYSILLQSVAYSLFHFSPHWHSAVSYCKDENEAIHVILRNFLIQTKVN